MNKGEQIKILNDKIEANNAQYGIDRLNAEISAYSSGDLDKYEFLTKQDLGYKPDALEQAKFEYSPLVLSLINDGLNKKDKTKKVGIVQRLKNIEDNLSRNDGDKVVKDIPLGDLEDLGDLDLGEFIEEYLNKEIKTKYKKLNEWHHVDNDIYKDLVKYKINEITKDVFLEKYIDFINKFNAFINAQKNKRLVL